MCFGCNPEQGDQVSGQRRAQAALKRGVDSGAVGLRRQGPCQVRSRVHGCSCHLFRRGEVAKTSRSPDRACVCVRAAAPVVSPHQRSRRRAPVIVGGCRYRIRKLACARGGTTSTHPVSPPAGGRGYQITEHDANIEIQVHETGVHSRQLLASLQDCQEGRCGCPATNTIGLRTWPSKPIRQVTKGLHPRDGHHSTPSSYTSGWTPRRRSTSRNIGSTVSAGTGRRLDRSEHDLGAIPASAPVALVISGRPNTTESRMMYQGRRLRECLRRVGVSA
jgi:hypothetical protein